MPKKIDSKKATPRIINSLDISRKKSNWFWLSQLTTAVLKDMLRTRGIGIPKNKTDMVDLLVYPAGKGKITFSVRMMVHTEKL